MLMSVAFGRRHGVLERVSDPSGEPVSLSEAKAFLRVDGSDEDDIIMQLISAARHYAEEYMRRSLITQSWTLWFDDYVPSFITLPMGPVQSVTHVKTYDRAGAVSTVDSVSYRLDAGKTRLLFDAAPMNTRIEVSYVTGYGASSDVPGAIKQGLLHHIASMFDDRVEGLGLTEQARTLYKPYKVEML